MFARLLASKVALGAAVVIVAVLLGGVSFGALGGAAPFATALGVTPLTGPAPLADETRGDRAGKLAEILDKLVQNGTISAEQKDKILAAVREAAQHEGGRSREKAIIGNLLEDAAKIIGIDLGTLKQELPGHSLAQVAQSHGVSRDTLVRKLADDVNGRIDKTLADNKITKEQADKLKAQAPEMIGRFVDHMWVDRKPRQHDGGRHFIGNLFEDAAKAIGISADDLKKELPGHSMAQVAQSHGVTRDALVRSMTTSATAAIDKAVADGKLGRDQADKLKANLAQVIGTFVDRVTPARSIR